MPWAPPPPPHFPGNYMMLQVNSIYIVRVRCNCCVQHTKTVTLPPQCSPSSSFHQLIQMQSHRVQTVWQWPVSGVYSIMMVNQPSNAKVEVGSTPPFTLHHHEQNCDVRSRKERIKYLLHAVPVTVKKLFVINYERFEFIPLISTVSGC